MKILLGCPTSDHKAYCLKEFAESVKNLSYDVDILLVDNSAKADYVDTIEAAGLPAVRIGYSPKARDRIIKARNVLRQKVLDEGYDYFFSLEQDVIPPVDVVQRLLAHGKKIVTGVYFILRQEYGYGEKMLTPLVFTGSGDQLRYMKFEEVEENALLEVQAAGLGVVLIHRDVLEKVQFRYDPARDAFDDMWFYRDAREQGFSVYCDTSVKCRHLMLGKSQKDLWEHIEK